MLAQLGLRQTLYWSAPGGQSLWNMKEFAMHAYITREIGCPLFVFFVFFFLFITHLFQTWPIWIEIANLKPLQVCQTNKKSPRFWWRILHAAKCWFSNRILVYIRWNKVVHGQKHHFNIPQCIRHISNNAQFYNKNVNISVTKWCIVGYRTGAVWDLHSRSIENILMG